MSFPRYPKYKPSGVEWLGEVPEHWDVTPFKWHIQCNDGGVWGQDPTGVDDTVVLRSTEQTVDGHWRIDAPALRQLTRDEVFAAMLLEGDLLLTKSSGSSLHIGKTTLVSAQIAAMRCCYSNFMQRIRTTRSFRPELAWYVLNSELARRQFDLLSNSTTGLANLNGSLIGQLIVPAPTVSEQRAIAAFLDRETAKIDALIAEQEKLIELLAEKRQAVISHAVTKGLNPAAPMKPSGVEWLGEVPAHWNIAPLRYMADCLDGIRVPLNAEQRSLRLGSIPYWGANSVVDHVDAALVSEPVVLLGEDGAPFFDKPKPVAFFVEEPVWPNNHVHVLRPRRSTKGAYLAAVLNITEYAHFIDGSTRDKLTQSAMNSIPIPMPPVDEQDSIGRHLAAADAGLAGLGSECQLAIDLLRERRSALISAAVTGQIDVRNAVPETAA